MGWRFHDKRGTALQPDDQTTQDRIAWRFAKVDLKHPVNAMLYDLAKARAARDPGAQPDFSAGMRPELPDAESYLAMKAKTSLLPLDTVTQRMKLPSLPAIVAALQGAVERGASSAELAAIIQTDPKLTTAVMSLVNSPIYALPFKTETLERALTVLGTREVSSLALASRLLAMFEDAAPKALPMETFWKHAIACAVLAHDLALLLGRPVPSRYLVAGLLHDLGRVLLFSRFPDEALVAVAMHQVERISLHEAEQWLFDLDHAMVGGIFLGEWGLPVGIVQSALYHHDPAACLGKELPEVVYVANQVATALGIGCNDLFTMDPGGALWERLDIHPTELASLVANAEERLWGMYCSLFPAARRCKA